MIIQQFKYNIYSGSVAVLTNIISFISDKSRCQQVGHVTTISTNPNIISLVYNNNINNDDNYQTKYICFKPNSLNGLFIPTLCLDDVPLTLVTSNTYLDVIIHDKHQNDDIMRYVKSVASKHVPPVLN